MSAFLEAAADIGAGLCRDAIWSGERCTWFGDRMTARDGTWDVAWTTLAHDLYGGTAGVGLFLARLAALTGEPVFRMTALGAALQTKFLLESAEDDPAALAGFFSGFAGTAYGLVHVGEAIGREDVAFRGRKLWMELALSRRVGDAADVISGDAGIIVAALLEHGQRPAQALLDWCVALGDRLLESGEPVAEGMCWARRSRQSLMTTGISHGTAGVAWALAELEAATGNGRYGEAARRGRAYERGLLRGTEGEAASIAPVRRLLSWCHGLPGLALAMLRLDGLLDGAVSDDAVRLISELDERAEENARAAGPDYSLCHGTAGILDALGTASRMTSDPAGRTRATDVAHRALQRYGEGRQAWPCGVPRDGYTPALMLGVSGTGAMLLRLHDPAAMPPLLLLLESESAAAAPAAMAFSDAATA